MSTFVSTLSSLASKRDFNSAISASTAIKRAFESATPGEGGRSGGGAGEGEVAAMPLSRQEATTHLRRRVNLERLPAWNMRGESRCCEQQRPRIGWRRRG